LNPEKMEELKEKYGITDDVIFEIAEAVEPDSEVPEFPNMGKPRTFSQPFSGGAPSSTIASAMKGDISIAEAIILMDYQDRRERRDEERRWVRPAQDTSNFDKFEKLLSEMREERKEYRDSIERLILSRRAEDAEEEAKRLKAEKEELIATQRQKEIIEGAVQGAVEQIGDTYGKRIDTLASRLQSVPENQRQGFWDELFTDFETDLRTQFKNLITSRLKEPEKPLTKTDEEGKRTVDWDGLLDRGYKLLDKYIDTQKGPPPKLPVRPVQPEGGAPGPLEEGPSEPSEGLRMPPAEEPPETVEVPVEKPAVTTPPIPVTNIAGIGPSRAKDLEGMGITDARQLSKVSPGHLAESLKINREKADDMVKQAKDLLDQA